MFFPSPFPWEYFISKCSGMKDSHIKRFHQTVLLNPKGIKIFKYNERTSVKMKKKKHVFFFIYFNGKKLQTQIKASHTQFLTHVYIVLIVTLQTKYLPWSLKNMPKLAYLSTWFFKATKNSKKVMSFFRYSK